MSNAMRTGKRTLAGVAAGALGAGTLMLGSLSVAQASVAPSATADVEVVYVAGTDAAISLGVYKNAEITVTNTGADDPGFWGSLYNGSATPPYGVVSWNDIATSGTLAAAPATVNGTSVANAIGMTVGALATTKTTEAVIVPFTDTNGNGTWNTGEPKAPYDITVIFVSDADLTVETTTAEPLINTGASASFDVEISDGATAIEQDDQWVYSGSEVSTGSPWAVKFDVTGPTGFTSISDQNIAVPADYSSLSGSFTASVAGNYTTVVNWFKPGATTATETDTSASLFTAAAASTGTFQPAALEVVTASAVADKAVNPGVAEVNYKVTVKSATGAAVADGTVVNFTVTDTSVKSGTVTPGNLTAGSAASPTGIVSTAGLVVQATTTSGVANLYVKTSDSTPTDVDTATAGNQPVSYSIAAAVGTGGSGQTLPATTYAYAPVAISAANSTVTLTTSTAPAYSNIGLSSGATYAVSSASAVTVSGVLKNQWNQAIDFTALPGYSAGSSAAVGQVSVGTFNATVTQATGAYTVSLGSLAANATFGVSASSTAGTGTGTSTPVQPASSASLVTGVTLAPGAAASVTPSSVTASPATASVVKATGTSVSPNGSVSVTYVVKNAAGSPIANSYVSIAGTGNLKLTTGAVPTSTASDALLSTVTGVTNAQGEIRVNVVGVATSAAAAANVTATAAAASGSASIAVVDAATPAAVAIAPTAGGSVPASVPAGSVTSMTATVTDANGNVVSGTNVQATITGDATFAASGSKTLVGITSTAGTLAFDVKAGASGSFTVTAASTTVATATATTPSIAIGAAAKSIAITAYRSGGTVVVDGDAVGFARGDTVNIRVKYYNANKKKYTSWRGAGTALVKSGGSFSGFISTNKQVKVKVNGGGTASNIETVK